MGYSNSKRPRLNIETDSFDKVIEITSAVALVLLIAVPLFYYTTLPETIPTHYGADGAPDDFGNKTMLWLLPTLGVLIYILLTYLNRFPHIFNYPQEITDQNVNRLYTTATRILRVLKAVILISFLYLCWSTVLIALGRQNELGLAFTPLFILISLSIAGYGSYKLMK